MSITIHRQPDEISPVYNQMIIACTSSNQTEQNFSFVGDIYVNGDWVSRLKVPVRPDGYGVFDVHKHIENRISYDFLPQTENQIGFFSATNSSATYSVEFSEEYLASFEFVDNFFSSGDVGFVGASGGSQPLLQVGDGVFVSQDEPFTNASYEGLANVTSVTFSSTFSAWTVTIDKGFALNTPAEGGNIVKSNYELSILETDVSTGELKAWNGVYSFQDFINYDFQDYIASTGSNAEFLTNMPNHYEVDLDARMWIMSYRNDLSSGTELVVVSNNGTYSIDTVSYGSSTSIGSYANSGGNLQVNCSSAHGLSLGSVVEISDSYAPYNGTWEVINVVSSTQVVVDSPYVANILSGIDNIKEVFSSGGDDFRLIGVGPYQLINGTSSITNFTGTFPIIDSSTNEYSFYLRDTADNQDYEMKTVKLNRKCTRYEKVQLIFLDKLGSFVPFNFNLVSKHNKSIERSEYQQHYGEYAPASSDWSYNTWDRGRKSLDTRVNNSYRVNSDWVNQETSNYLMELFESPEVYWVDEDGLYQAINITTTSVERKKVINDLIINYSLDFVLANRDHQQRS